MKHLVNDLALLGGEPAFSEPLHVGQPNIGDRQRFLARLGDMLDRRWLANGGFYVETFERRLEELLGVRHCVAMCNATVGLEITARALGLTGEVIVPSFTFVATPHSLQWQGLTPVFCDIDPRTYTIDPVQVEALIGPRTSGILAVHTWGRGCDVGSLAEIARRHGLKLYYDAAHALGCTIGGRPIGSFGQAEVFSFHATKFVNAFEGGAVATNDDEVAERLRLMRNYGFADYDRVDAIGTNGKMTEVSAAMGLTSLESMDEFVTVNREHYVAYASVLAGIPGVDLVPFDAGERCNLQYVTAEIDPDRFGMHRDTLLEVLRAEGVLARRYFYPGCHRMEPYRTLQPDAGKRLPVTERATDRVIQLPTGTGVSAEDVLRIGEIVRFAIRNAEVLAERLDLARLQLVAD